MAKGNKNDVDLTDVEMLDDEQAALMRREAEDAIAAAGIPEGKWSISSMEQVRDQSFSPVYPIPEGRGVRGTFEGPGEPVLMNTPGSTGEKRPVGTWRIRVSEQLCLLIPTAAQLDSRLPTYPIGAEISIIKQRGKVESRAGNQVRQYLISDPPKVLSGGGAS
jgi:hypothetical protein